MLESKIWEEAEQKSKAFLREVMGNDVFDEFIKNGKIDIKSNNVTYELYDDGRVINKTANQRYCIVPDKSDYPDYDVLAIKFAWLKYGQKTVDKVANKTNIEILGRDTDGYRRHDNTTGYAAFVDYMESNGWRREQLTIDEHNTNLIATHSVERETTGAAIEIRCPAGQSITMMGVNQVPQGADGMSANTIALRIADKNDIEISGNTAILIDKIRPSQYIVALTRGLYSLFSLTRQIGNEKCGIRAYKSYDELYRWRYGTHLTSDDILRVHIINSPIDTYGENTKISMDADFWIHHL